METFDNIELVERCMFILKYGYGAGTFLNYFYNLSLKSGTSPENIMSDVNKIAELIQLQEVDVYNPRLLTYDEFWAVGLDRKHIMNRTPQEFWIEPLSSGKSIVSCERWDGFNGDEASTLAENIIPAVVRPVVEFNDDYKPGDAFISGEHIYVVYKKNHAIMFDALGIALSVADANNTIKNANL